MNQRIVKGPNLKLDKVKEKKATEVVTPTTKMEKDIIRIIMQDYNNVLNLTPGRNIYSAGDKRTANYEDIINKRWDLCQGCEFLKNDKCEKCGCFMKVKTRIATARCPIGKWEKEYDFMKGKKVGSLITN